MRKLKPIIAFFLCCLMLGLTACKSINRLSIGSAELKIGVTDIEGNFNPFYSGSRADREILSQMFRSIQRRGSDNKLINDGGGISYEYVGDSQVQYTVSIKDDMRFSDGSYITIDDVIFYYHFISDATYTGVYSDWYLNDIVGLKEYYFDDKNYRTSIANLEKTVEENYTVTTIEPEDYSEYLVATRLEGKFTGGLDSVSPSGAPWSEYIEKQGFRDELKELGANPTDAQILKLAADVEANENPLAYNPETWYREKLYTEYVEKNYANGINVNSIEGIKKVNDYTCTILFNSSNVNAVSEINALLVSGDYYSTEYVKGTADKIKDMDGFAVCSGPYIIADYSDGEVAMAANEFYNDADCEFGILKFVDLAIDGDDPVDSVVSGDVDVVKTLASSAVVNELTDKPVEYFINNCDYYTTLFFNTRSLDASLRKALMGLCSVSNIVEQSIGSYYTQLFRPLSIRFSEYPDAVTQPYYNESAYTVYSMVNGTAPITVSAYYCGEETDLEYTVLSEYGNLLSQKNIKLEITLADEQTLEDAVISGKADMWISDVPDGATCDKFDYFNSSGTMNKTALNNPEIDSLTASIRSAVGFADKKVMTASLMDMVMEQAVENPLYQLQTITIYNTDTINPDSFDSEQDFDGYSHAIPMLKKN